MIDNDTLTRLRLMRLSGMANALEHLAEQPVELGRLTAPQIVAMAVDWEWERRRDAKLLKLRKNARLAQPQALITDLTGSKGRIIDLEFISRLATGTYIAKHQDVIIQGPTGTGKTFVACALANAACQQYRTVLYLTAADLFDRLCLAEATDTKASALDTLAKAELLVIDDWFLTPPTKEQVRNLHTLIDRRHRTGSTIFATQLGPGNWHDRIEEKIVADAIIDRITSNAHTTKLDGEVSLRRQFNSLT